MIYTYRDFEIELFEDAVPPNPRFEHQNLGTMVCFGLGGDTEEHNYIHSNMGFDYLPEEFEALRERIIKEQGAVLILPVYRPKYGKQVSTEPFSDGHQTGFIYAKRGFTLAWFGKKRMTPSLKARVTEVLRCEVIALNQFRTGDVWGFCITDPDGSPCSACSGFFGLEYCKEEAQNIVDSQWDLIEKEKEIIDSISDNDLPLYVNHKWGNSLSEWYFKRRFKL
jgi:hypothetical protein